MKQHEQSLKFLINKQILQEKLMSTPYKKYNRFRKYFSDTQKNYTPTVTITDSTYCNSKTFLVFQLEDTNKNFIHKNLYFLLYKKLKYLIGYKNVFQQITRHFSKFRFPAFRPKSGTKN